MTILKNTGSALLSLLDSDASVGQVALRAAYVGIAIMCAISAVGYLSRLNACEDAEFDLARPKGGALMVNGAEVDAAQERVAGVCMAHGR